ncbi:M20 family metallopeptidase [Gordonia sp. TBRC 11910]|uniref:Probable succinyl-diaminopimelate desuccinylase n=1 Tax=Gordonia asplenii TaxID=2725283 RepID=A0A848KYG7_9ACTN|nr:M20 family metallopeptidase [Gordonia asplenii]NMO03636.1 M20 family metallopeptidase [Gordonia asplenii]
MTAIERFIDTDALTELTVALVETASENPGGTEAAAVAVLEKACAELGLTTSTHEVEPGRPNMTATLSGGNGPGLMFLGHSDVVPAGPGWTDDPYRARIVDGRIIGRGTSDMKGGLAAIAIAMGALASTGVELSGPVELVATVDEEEMGLGARNYVAHQSDSRFVGCVVAEPTNMRIVHGCRGAAYLHIDVTGRAAHSGRTSDGRSAIDAAAAIIDLIHDDEPAVDPILGPGSWNVGLIQGGQGISIVAPSCYLGVDRRLAPGERMDDIARIVRAKIEAAGIVGDGIGVELRPTPDTPAFVTSPDDPLVVDAAAVLDELALPSGLTTWSAACDGGFINGELGIPTIVLGPGDINTQAHQADESVSIDELVCAAQVYLRLATRMLG